MAGEEIVDVAAFFLTNIGKIGLWMRAVGIVVIIWVVFQVISTIFNMRRMNEIKVIKEDMERIEGKIDKILKRD